MPCVKLVSSSAWMSVDSCVGRCIGDGSEMAAVAHPFVMVADDFSWSSPLVVALIAVSLSGQWGVFSCINAPWFLPHASPDGRG